MNGLLRDCDLRAALRQCLWALALCLAAGIERSASGQTDPAGSISSPPPPTSEEFRRTLQLPVSEALRAQQPDRRGKELIDKVVHYYVALQADPAQALQRQENRKRLMDLLRPRTTTDGARSYAYDQIILRCRQLFNEQDAAARVAACYLLNELNTSFNPDVPYVPAADALLLTLAFPDDKYVQVKAVAVTGLARILRDAPATALPITKRFDIGDKLAAEINRLRSERGKPNAAPLVGHQWLMWQLVTALGYCDRVYNQSRQPVFADALLGVLLDKGEDWLARARAGQALTRLQYEGNADLGVLNYEIAKLLHDFSQQYNTLLAGGQVLPMSRRIALHVYFAYYGQTTAERALNIGLNNQTNRSGLAGHKAGIDGARQACLPIINGLVSNTGTPRPIPAADIANLQKWLSDHTPAPDAKLVPESTVQRNVPQTAPAPAPQPAPASASPPAAAPTPAGVGTAP